MSIEKTGDLTPQRGVQKNETNGAQTEQNQVPKIEIKFTIEQQEKLQNALQYLNEHSENLSEEQTEAEIKKLLGKDKQGNDLWESYKDGWKEDFKDADGVGGFLMAMVNRTRKGFKSLDAVNPMTYVKEPIKKAAEKIDELVTDGDPSTMTADEKVWGALKGAGGVADYLTTTEGIWVAGATILTAGTTLDAALGVAPNLAAAAPAANAALGTAGVGITGKGVFDVATAENEDEAKKGGAEILTGGMMAGGAVASAKNALSTARAAGVEAVDPANLTTMGAVKENFRVAGEGLKIATGMQAPSMYMKIPATAIRFESKPNQVEAYQTTGKADGIVFEKDGKLFVPNKWNPEAPYEVKNGSIIMIYDKAGGDFAVCDPKIFSKTYVNGDGAYDAMKGIKPGETISATKKAVGGFEIVPAGTKVKTLEGDVVVKQGQAVMYDVDGNPYVGDIKNSLLKRNVPVGEEATKAFKQLESKKLYPSGPQNVEQCKNLIMSDLSDIPAKFKAEAEALCDKNIKEWRSYSGEKTSGYRPVYDYQEGPQLISDEALVKMDILQNHGIKIKLDLFEYHGDHMKGAWIEQNGLKSYINNEDFSQFVNNTLKQLAE